jgi:ABC-type glycerol-3-phosphate transport system substrate-binding protein
MKKVIAILAIATSLVACGGNASTEAKADSTAVSVDTTKVDSTVVAPAADTTIAK